MHTNEYIPYTTNKKKWAMKTELNTFLSTVRVYSLYLFLFFFCIQFMSVIVKIKSFGERSLLFGPRSQQLAAAFLLRLADLQRRPGGHLEHFPHAVLGLGRALQIAKSTDSAGHVFAFFRPHRLLWGWKRNCCKVIYKKKFFFKQTGISQTILS